MLESVLVYSTLTLIMVMCGFRASHRQLVFDKKHGQHTYKRELSFSYSEVWIPIIIFAIIFGCRYDVGVDQLTYLDYYLGTMPNDKEFLWRFVADLLKRCGVHYALYFSLWAFIQIFFLYFTIKDKRYLFPYVSLYLFIGSFYLPMMNGIRFMVAASIFFFSIHYIINHQFGKYLICILIASLFHKTAIALILVYPFLIWYNTKNFTRLQQLIVLVFVGIFLIFEETFYQYLISLFGLAIDLLDYHEGYNYILKFNINYILNQGSHFGRNTGLGTYITLFIVLVLIYYSKNLKKYYRSTFFDYSYLFCIISYLIGFITQHSYVLGRPLLYFNNFKLLTLAFFTYYCFKSKKLVNVIMGMLFILIHIVLFSNIISMGEVNKSAFTFFWQH